MTTPKTTTARRATVAAAKPKFIVVDGVFIAQSSEGEIKIPLKFKTKLFRQIATIDNEIEQVFALLDGIGDQKASDQLDELDIFEMQEVVKEFFAKFQEKSEASLGESERSSAK